MPAWRCLFSFFLLPLIATASAADQPVDYLREIKPILSRHCYECHNADKQKGGLRLDTAEWLRKGGDSGDPIVAGNVEKSLFIEMLHESKVYPRMPYKRTPLNPKEIRLLEEWVKQGAKAPEKETVVDARGHWAFQVPVRPKLPAVKNGGWVKNPLDRFILAELEKKNLTPSSEADRVTLIRRLYLDLLGLPPSVEEVDDFVNDSRPDAYEQLVDRLLASPHYGERWGRHWLDVARYGDSNGFTIDSPRSIWKYRDWVIDSLNQDMPFNQFVIEQIAGDMLPGAGMSQKIATGFHRNTLRNEEGGIDVEQFRVDAVADRVNTTGVVFLGLTFGCARCHDHKYDPISQKEYYQIFAFLNNQAEPTLSIANAELAAKREKLTEQMEKLEEELNKEVEAFVKKQTEAGKEKLKDSLSEILRLNTTQRTDKQKVEFAKYFRAKSPAFKKGFDELDAIKKSMPNFPTTLVLQEMPKPRVTHIHLAGDFTRPGPVVQSHVPSVLHSLPEKKGGYNRLDLARWLVDPKNPLIARVTVNRFWQQYFGTGLVETENDFGTQGSEPTHPQLLDWLAVEFMSPSSSGGKDTKKPWSMKHIHRLIVTSATYRQSSKMRADVAKVDPYNKLLARQNRLRLDAEIIRDNALAVSGLLSRKVGGPSVYPPQPDGIYRFTQVNREWKTSKGDDRYRRGVYTFFQRSAPYPALIVFDAPDGTSTCTRRVRSNTPLQALTLLNDQAFLELARGLANRVLTEGPKDDKGRINYAFRLCLARAPSEYELGRLEQYLTLQHKAYQQSPKDALAFLTFGQNPKEVKTPNIPNEQLAEQATWTALSRALLNLDEFITRE
jgi:mono/diheme cytochrome c family protein/cytochrome c553